MEVNSAKPAATDVASLSAASSQQAAKFNQRKSIEAQSDVKNEAVFFSPVVKIDKETQAMVMQYRDPNTGEVTRQYPDKAKIDAYEQAQETVPAPKEASSKADAEPVVAEASEVKVAVEQKPVEKAPQPKVEKEPSVDEQV